MNKSTYHIFFNNFSNPLRIEIILQLREKNLNVSQISKSLKVEQSKVSHALKSLKNCRIVSSKRKGKQIIYSLNKDTIIPILKIIDKHAARYCDCKCCLNKTCGGKK
jgi:DNA-binding transcriptional ArsR family regulator